MPKKKSTAPGTGGGDGDELLEALVQNQAHRLEQLEERLLQLEGNRRGGEGEVRAGAMEALNKSIRELAESVHEKLAQMRKDLDEQAMVAQYASAKHADLKKEMTEQHRLLRIECAPRTPLGGGQVSSELCEKQQRLESEVELLSASLGELRKECNAQAIQGGLEAGSDTSPSDELRKGQQRLESEVVRLAESLSELKKVVAKDSMSLASNIKHTSKLLMDFSELRSNNAAKNEQFANKSDLKILQEQSQEIEKRLNESISSAAASPYKGGSPHVGPGSILETSISSPLRVQSPAPAPAPGNPLAAIAKTASEYFGLTPEVESPDQPHTQPHASSGEGVATRASCSRTTPQKQLSSAFLEKSPIDPLKFEPPQAPAPGAISEPESRSCEQAAGNHVKEKMRVEVKRHSDSIVDDVEHLVSDISKGRIAVLDDSTVDNVKNWQVSSSEHLQNRLQDASDAIQKNIPVDFTQAQATLTRSFDMISSPIVGIWSGLMADKGRLDRDRDPIRNPPGMPDRDPLRSPPSTRSAAVSVASFRSGGPSNVFLKAIAIPDGTPRSSRGGTGPATRFSKRKSQTVDSGAKEKDGAVSTRPFPMEPSPGPLTKGRHYLKADEDAAEELRRGAAGAAGAAGTGENPGSAAGWQVKNRHFLKPDDD